MTRNHLLLAAALPAGSRNLLLLQCGFFLIGASTMIN